MLINFEGLDGTGKSTLIKEVSKKLDNTLTKEPGSPHIPVNTQIRELVLHNQELSPFQRELLFYTDALGHKKFIEKQKGLVLSDRGLWSHYSYLYGYMKLDMLGDDLSNYPRYGIGKKLIKECCAEPKAVVYLEGNLELMRERLKGQKDAIESLPKEFFAYVLAAYDDLIMAAEFEQKPILILDAKSSVEENTMKTLQFIEGLQKNQA